MTDGAPRTTVVKHSLSIAGHRTSVSLEAAFWRGLVAIAAQRRTSVAALVAAIDQDRGAANLSSAIRVFVLDHARRHTQSETGDRAVNSG